MVTLLGVSGTATGADGSDIAHAPSSSLSGTMVAPEGLLKPRDERMAERSSEVDPVTDGPAAERALPTPLDGSAACGTALLPMQKQRRHASRTCADSEREAETGVAIVLTAGAGVLLCNNRAGEMLPLSTARTAS